MASADFCPPIPPPHDGDSQWQVDRPPRVMCATFPLIPAASTSAVSVQVSGFEDIGLLTHCDRLVCDSCSSGQCFACGFLQIPPHGGHPCRPANGSPCRASRGLSPPNDRAMPGTHKKRARKLYTSGPSFIYISLKPGGTRFQGSRRGYLISKVTPPIPSTVTS
jgi:hypothetical protein